MDIDMRAVMFLGIIVCLVCTLFVVQLCRQNCRRYAGMRYWVFGYILQTAVLVLLAMRNAVPDWISIVLANVLMFAGTLLLYMGLERFVGKISAQLHNYFLFFLYAGAFVYATYMHPDVHLRMLVASLGLLIISFQCLWLMLRRVEPGMRQLTFWVGIAFGGYCLISIFRIFEYFVAEHVGNDLFSSGAVQTMAIVAYQVVFMLLTYSLVLMVNKRLLMEISSQEEKFAVAFQAAPYALAFTRPADGLIVDVNECFLYLLGYERGEVVGKTTLDLNIWEHDEDRAAVVEALSRKLKVRGMEVVMRKKSGELLTALFYAETIRLKGEMIILSCIEDITDRKKAEVALQKAKDNLEATVVRRTGELKEHYDDLAKTQTAMLYMVEDLNRQAKELKDAQERIVRSEKLAVVGQLASSVAHELRNPLGVIRNAVYYLNMLELGKDSLDIKENLDIISDEINNSDKVISDLLEFSRIKQPDLKPEDINSIIKDTLTRLKAPEGIKIVADLGENLPQIQADAQQLQQVFYNLGVNAIQAIGHSGILTVSSRMASDQTVAVAFKDTGCGIPKDHLSKIFEPLFSTKAKGTGLGLSVVASFVEGHGGKIELESAVGKGSVFTVKFPV